MARCSRACWDVEGRLTGTRVKVWWTGWKAALTDQSAAETRGWPPLGFSPGKWQRPADMANVVSVACSSVPVYTVPCYHWCDPPGSASVTVCGTFCCTSVQTLSQTVPLGAAQDVFPNWKLNSCPAVPEIKCTDSATLSLEGLRNSHEPFAFKDS